MMCPLCGMIPFLENLEQTAKEKPADVRIFLLKFGGKLPPGPVEVEAEPKKKGRGKAPGYMEMVDITEQVPEQLSQVRKFFADRAKQFLARIE